MEHTQNYQLSQWSKDDYIRMEDFNGDNEKIDRALARLERAAWELAYYQGQLALRDYIDQDQSRLGQSSMIVEPFVYREAITDTTAGITIENGALTLSGQQTGTARTGDMSLGSSDWTEARLWVHRMATGSSTVKVTLNGEEMALSKVSNFVRTVDGQSSALMEFRWSGTGKSTAQLAFELDRSSSETMYVYDYVLCVR